MPCKPQIPSETRHCPKRKTNLVRTVMAAFLIQEQLQTCLICNVHTMRRLKSDPQSYSKTFRQLQKQTAPRRRSAHRQSHLFPAHSLSFPHQKPLAGLQFLQTLCPNLVVYPISECAPVLPQRSPFLAFYPSPQRYPLQTLQLGKRRLALWSATQHFPPRLPML